MLWSDSKSAGGTSKLRLNDVDDLVQDAVVRTVRHLTETKQKTKSHSPIGSLKAFVTTTSRNVYHEALSDLRPARKALKDQICYVVSTRDGLSLWEEKSSRTGKTENVVGLSAWKCDGLPVDYTGRIEQIVSDRLALERLSFFDRIVHLFRPKNVPKRDEMASMHRLLVYLVGRVGAPLPFSDLVSAVCTAFGLPRVAEVEEVDDADENFYGAGTDALYANPLDRYIDKESFCRIWTIVRTITLPQRRALLLHAAFPTSTEPISVCHLAQEIEVETKASLAEMLHYELEWIDQTWRDLPLEDNVIARKMNVDRNRVIALRRLAKLYLARQLGKQND